MKKTANSSNDIITGGKVVVSRPEESLQEGEVLYKTLVNTLPHPILIHVDGRVVFANDVVIEVTGLDKDKIIGKLISELLTDPNDTKNKTPFSNPSPAGFVEEEEFEIRTENRKFVIKNFLLKNSRIKYRGEDAVMTILIDITERKHLEKYLLSKVIETEEKARKQFAADLHDDLGPTLSSIKLHLGLLEHSKNPKKFSETLGIANELLSEAIAKMRLIANNLMPRLIENYGLEAAVNAFINTIPKKGGLTIEFASNLRGRRFPRPVELHFYRITCELINNTIKHSGATLTSVKFSFIGGVLRLTYTDNGKGYDVEEIKKKGGGMGVSNILQRVSVIDGKVEFSKKKGKVIVRIWKEL